MSSGSHGLCFRLSHYPSQQGRAAHQGQGEPAGPAAPSRRASLPAGGGDRRHVTGKEFRPFRKDKKRFFKISNQHISNYQQFLNIIKDSVRTYHVSSNMPASLHLLRLTPHQLTTKIPRPASSALPATLTQTRRITPTPSSRRLPCWPRSLLRLSIEGRGRCPDQTPGVAYFKMAVLTHHQTII